MDKFHCVLLTKNVLQFFFLLLKTEFVSFYSVKVLLPSVYFGIFQNIIILIESEKKFFVNFCLMIAFLMQDFLAHLSTTCSRGAFRVVMCPSSTISLNIFSSQTAGPIWTKLGRNVPWNVLFKICSQNLIPSKTLVPMATKLNFLSNSLKIFSSEIAGPILK